jgi:hypothetical protein
MLVRHNLIGRSLAISTNLCSQIDYFYPFISSMNCLLVFFRTKPYQAS